MADEDVTGEPGWGQWRVNAVTTLAAGHGCTGIWMIDLDKRDIYGRRPGVRLLCSDLITLRG